MFCKLVQASSCTFPCLHPLINLCSPHWEDKTNGMSDHLYALMFLTVKKGWERKDKCLRNLSGNIQKSLELFLASGLCLTEQAQSKHRSTLFLWKQRMWCTKAKSPLSCVWNIQIQQSDYFQLSLLCFVDLDRLFILDDFYILTHIFVPSVSLYGLTSWLWKEPVLMWLACSVSLLPFFYSLSEGADVSLKAGTEALAASFRE